MKYFLILLIIAFSCTSSTCNKRITCNQTIFSFKTNIRAFPDSDSILINDTIWLDFSCPTQLYDEISAGTVDYSGAANFGTAIGVFEFTGGSISNPGGIGAVNSFDYKLVNGIFLPDYHLPNENIDYRFAEIGNEYRFKLGFIPKRKGIFAVSPGNASNVYTRKNKCDKAGFSITFANTNQHLYFYEQNRPGYTPSEYEKTHMYCFKVR
jgi:hypothetical protein